MRLIKAIYKTIFELDKEEKLILIAILGVVLLIGSLILKNLCMVVISLIIYFTPLILIMWRIGIREDINNFIKRIKENTSNNKIY